MTVDLLTTSFLPEGRQKLMDSQRLEAYAMDCNRAMCVFACV